MRSRLVMRRRARSADSGSVLPMVLVLLVVGAMIVGGLLRYTATVTRTQPQLTERPVASESAASAMRQAILLQVAAGPGVCTSSGTYAPGAFSLNGYSTTVACSTLQLSTTGSGRYGVITTRQDPTRSALRGLDGDAAGSRQFDIDGDVFLDGGDLAEVANSRVLVRGNSVEPHVIRYSDSVATAPGVPTPVTPVPERYRVIPPAPAGGDDDDDGGSVLDPVTGLPLPLDAAGSVVVACDTAVAFDVDTYPEGVSQVSPAGGPFSHEHPACGGTTGPWWDYAGADPNPLDGTDDRVYPLLPQLPTYQRDGRYVDIGGCRVYYPGRYTSALTLDASRQHYFASGLYYFTAPLSIVGGARAVMGEGRTAGCAVDADAALAQNAPINHEITGKGATILLGGAATVTVQDASLAVNRRVSSPSTRGSEGMAIRTVNAGSSTALAQVPRDRVQEGEYPCVESSPGVCADPFVADPTNGSNAVDVGAHEIVVSTSPLQTVAYTPSSLGLDDPAVTLEVIAPSSQSGTGLTTDGNVFVPNARFVVDTTAAAPSDLGRYHLDVRAGVVSSAVDLLAERIPTAPASNWFLGVASEPIQRRVELVATASGAAGTAVSRAVVEVHESGSYAINAWSVDAPGLG